MIRRSIAFFFVLAAPAALAQPTGTTMDAKPAAAKHRNAVSAANSASERAAPTSATAVSAGGVDAKPAKRLEAVASASSAPSNNEIVSSAAALKTNLTTASQTIPSVPAIAAVPAESAPSAGAAAAPVSGVLGAGAPAESFPIAEDSGVFLLALAVAVPAVLLGLGYWRERKQAAYGPPSPTSIVWWGVAFVMAAVSVIYAGARRDTIGFWDGMVGSWLATLLGIVCGVPVALELERQRKRAEEAAKADAAKQLRAQVVGLLRDELERIGDQLKERTDPATGLPIEPLKTSIWDATRVSGNLAAIPEPELLQVFSEAYRWVGMIATLEAQRIELLFGNDRVLVGGKYASEKLEELIRTFLPPATDWVSHAVAFTANLASAATSQAVATPAPVPSQPAPSTHP